MSKPTALTISAIFLCIYIFVITLVLATLTKTYRQERQQAEELISWVVEKDERTSLKLEERWAMESRMDFLRRLEANLRRQRDALRRRVDMLEGDLYRLRATSPVPANVQPQIHTVPGGRHAYETWGGEFAYGNVSLRALSPRSCEAIGEITNRTSKDYDFAQFALSVFDEKGLLKTVRYFEVYDFNNGQTLTFSAHVDTGINVFARYKIDFQAGCDRDDLHNPLSEFDPDWGDAPWSGSQSLPPSRQ